MIEISEEQELIKHLDSHEKTIALFYSSWCPFCKSFLPTFNKHAAKKDSDIFIQVQIDEDENPMWETYFLDAVPSIIIFENGKISRRLDCQRGLGLNEKQHDKFLESK